MKHVLLLDTETTGTDESAVCIEVAAALYSVEHAAVVSSFSSLVESHDGNPAERVNGIAPSILPTAPEPAWVWWKILDLAVEVDAVVAHGAEFDRRFVPVGRIDHVDSLLLLPWICTLDDVSWPRGTGKRESLVQLALAHGLGVGSAHRAMADVDLLARLLTRVREMGVDLGTFLARGLRPKARFAVAARGFDAKRNELAKAHGFAWDPDARVWARNMAIEDAAALPFEVRRC